MQRPPDPYRVLGLPRGASLAEVKRAYRQLVKESHPDAAGPRAVDRFLAVQAAYRAILEAVAGGAAIGEARPPTREEPQRAAWSRRRRSGWPGPGAPGDRSNAAPAGGSEPSGDERDGATGTRRRTARLGSTSYDDAPEFEPLWEGASWYGEASGTYWTINPREYADPRKHGPEYLARARGGGAGWDDAPLEDEPLDGEPDAAAHSEAPPGGPEDGAI